MLSVGHTPLPVCPPCQQKQDEINANTINYDKVIPAQSLELSEDGQFMFVKTDNSWGVKLNMKQKIDCTYS